PPMRSLVFDLLDLTVVARKAFDLELLRFTRSLVLDLLDLTVVALTALPFPPPPPIRSLVLDLLLLTVVVFAVAPCPVVGLMPPKPGGLNCANADSPDAITKTVVTAASSIPLKRMLMTVLPESATAPCRLAGSY